MFRTVPLSIIRSFSLYTQQYIQVCWHVPLLCVQWKTPNDGQRKCQKHVEFYSENKFDKLVRLVGFIIRICHDARSSERQIRTNFTLFFSIRSQCMQSFSWGSPYNISHIPVNDKSACNYGALHFCRMLCSVQCDICTGLIPTARECTVSRKSLAYCKLKARFLPFIIWLARPVAQS